jgi:hypothetical protein
MGLDHSSPMPDTQASITAALAAQRAFWSGGGSSPVEFRLQALRQMLHFLN